MANDSSRGTAVPEIYIAQEEHAPIAIPARDGFDSKALNENFPLAGFSGRVVGITEPNHP